MDTINFKLGIEKVGKIKLLEYVPQFLQDVSTHSYENGNISISGKLKNLKVSVSENAITIKNGSLTKWYLDNNLRIMTMRDIKQAIIKLSDTVHLPMNKADVISFHFGKNIITEHETSLYLPYLGSNGRYIRLEQPKGLNYKITGRELSFYDKISEMKKRNDFIPPLYEGKNVIRYEKRYERNLTKYFNREMILAETLYEEQFYVSIINDWYNDYLNIQKQKKIKPDMTTIKTKEQMKMLGVLTLVKDLGGKLAALQDLKERQSKGELTKKQAHDLKQLIEKSQTLKFQLIESDLIIELDKKMNNAIKYFR